MKDPYDHLALGLPFRAGPHGPAGDRVFRRFCLPRLSDRRGADHGRQADRARFHLRHAETAALETIEGPVRIYTFNPPEGTAVRGSVLVLHGWTSEASFMALIGESLRRAGFRAVLFDQPGHGKNRRPNASLIDVARATEEVAHTLGPFDAVVAHSMGGLAALLVGEAARPLRGGYQFPRYVLISTPNDFAGFASDYARDLGVSRAAERQFMTQLSRVAHRPVPSVVAARLLAGIGRPALVVHSRDDTEVGFDSAEAIAAVPGTQLLAVDGLGHRNILMASPVVRAVVQYLVRA